MSDERRNICDGFQRHRQHLTEGITEIGGHGSDQGSIGVVGNQILKEEDWIRLRGGNGGGRNTQCLDRAYSGDDLRVLDDRGEKVIKSYDNLVHESAVGLNKGEMSVGCK